MPPVRPLQLLLLLLLRSGACSSACDSGPSAGLEGRYPVKKDRGPSSAPFWCGACVQLGLSALRLAVSQHGSSEQLLPHFNKYVAKAT